MRGTASLMSALLVVTVSCASAERAAPDRGATEETQAMVAGGEGFELAPGVVVQPARAIYLSRPEGGMT